MSKEAKEFIAKQKKLFIKINNVALNDIEEELEKSDKKNKRKKPIVDRNAGKRRKIIATSNPVTSFLNEFKNTNKGKKARYFDIITKNYIIDMTDRSEGSQAILFSDDLKDYLKNICIRNLPKPDFSNINIIKRFESKPRKTIYKYL
ncbi:hypothetical protein BDF14DRAFT_1399658 [Spinellus fusiger]|nr:hypothetical protein BDF14DRAFT_1399658 [Spinellus fusiger]